MENNDSSKLITHTTMDEYNKSIRKMSDQELWDHCMGDDTRMNEFCVQELKMRFLKRSLSEDDMEQIWIVINRLTKLARG